jgi:hypothetical protein
VAKITETGPDAELIAACAAFDALERQRSNVFHGPEAITDEAPRLTLFAFIQEMQEPILNRVCSLRATTLEGYFARARTVLLEDLELHPAEMWNQGRPTNVCLALCFAISWNRQRRRDTNMSARRPPRAAAVTDAVVPLQLPPETAEELAASRKTLLMLQEATRQVRQRNLQNAVFLAQQALGGRGPLGEHFAELRRRYGSTLGASSKPRFRVIEGDQA